jgi:large subunit ribosomal protein L3
MSLGLVGRKIGMTRIFTDDGVSIPVTVLDVSNNRVSQVKTASHGWLFRTSGSLSACANPVVSSKPVAGHLAKSGVDAAIGMMEFRIG